MHLYSHRKPKPAKTAAVVRYGGLGDAIQSSSILPWLKDDGYHITFYTVPPAFEVLKHDPHIDRFIIQEVDAIPNVMLGEFWASARKKYSRFINLSESVEKSLLAFPDNINHGWPHSMRHKHMNKNYMEFIHDIAEVPLPVRTKFYATEEEKAWALSEHRKIGGVVILFLLSGSAVHKVWPHMDTFIDAILTERPDVRFVLAGDHGCKMLEAGWEKTPQVHCKSGEWSVRQTMAFAQVCDIVIGPETGVMNAVSMADVPKVVLLSHSSIENLTRDWVNCVSLTPTNTACYPCHRIHFNFDHCVQSSPQSKVALCQFNISKEAMMTAVGGLIHKTRLAA